MIPSVKSRREIRPPALRLRTEISEFTVQDMFAGEYTGAVDDVVVRRNDGTYALQPSRRGR